MDLMIVPGFSKKLPYPSDNLLRKVRARSLAIVRTNRPHLPEYTVLKFVLSIVLGAYYVSGSSGIASEAPPDSATRFTVDVPAGEAPQIIQVANGEDSIAPFAVSANVTVASRYFLQGSDLSYGHAVLQPNASFGVGGVSISAWSNCDLATGDLNEVDLTFQVAREAGPWSMAMGYIHLSYPNREDWLPSQEVFANVSAGFPLNRSVSIHYDFDAGMGSYSTLEVSHSLGSIVSGAGRIFSRITTTISQGFPRWNSTPMPRYRSGVSP